MVGHKYISVKVGRFATFPKKTLKKYLPVKEKNKGIPPCSRNKRHYGTLIGNPSSQIRTQDFATDGCYAGPKNVEP